MLRLAGWLLPLASVTQVVLETAPLPAAMGKEAQLTISPSGHYVAASAE